MPKKLAGNSDKKIKEEAHKILLKNRKEGISPWAKTHYSFSCPSLKIYPYQWFWDSCFHIIVLSRLDLDLAKKELQSLLQVQDEDGFIPHMIFWEKPFFSYTFLQSKETFGVTCSSLIQPPVLAQSLAAIFQKSGDQKFLKEFLAKVEKYYLWLEKFRDSDKDSLISIISPFESGLDYKPSYDVLYGCHPCSRATLTFFSRKIDLRNKFLKYDSKKILEKDYFNVEDVMVNCIFAQGLFTLSWLFEAVGEGEKAKNYKKKAKLVEETIFQKMFEPADGLFYDLYGRDERKARVKTVTSLFPLILETIDRNLVKNLIENHLLNEKEFWPPYPVPSVSLSEASFDPSDSGFLWRGPTWINMNWFLVKGLIKHGYNDVAAKIIQKTKGLVLKEGFREFYHPVTGKGEGAKDFGWTTLIVDMLEE